MAGDKEIEGASKSLKKSIREIDDFLEGRGLAWSADGARAEFNEKVADLARYWYEKGFKRGHRDSFAAFQEDGEVPAKLRKNVSREFYHQHRKKVKLKSRIDVG